MSNGQDKQAGSALGAVLGERGCADQDAAGRWLLLTLIRLHELGALAFDSGGAVHGADAVVEPSTVAGPLGPLGLVREDELRGGGRVVLDGRGAVVSAALQTPPAYNMGESICIRGDEE